MRLLAVPVPVPLRRDAAAARLRALRPQPPPRLHPFRPPPPPVRAPRLARTRPCASLSAAGEEGGAEAGSQPPEAVDLGGRDLDITAAELVTKPNIRRYAWAPAWLRFPLFLFYSFYDNEAYRKLVWTFLMMICFFQGYNIPVPGLLPHRMKQGFSMDHLSALFMQDPAVTFINIYYVGFTPFLMFYLLGTVYMNSPLGHKLRKGRSPQHAMDEIFQMARSAGYAFVVVQVLFLQPFFRFIAMPAVKDMHWFEFFALTGCPMLWGSTMAIFFLTEVTNTGLVDGFAMAISSITAGMVVQVVSNWFNAALFYGHSLDLLAAAKVCGVYLSHVMLVVLLLNCQRRIALVYFARKTGGGSAEDEEARTTYLPIKGVASGIMPILVADMFTGGLRVGSNYFTIVAYIAIILSLCLVDFNNVPLELAEMLTKMGTRVQGVRPGKATVMYLQEQQQAVRLFGGLSFVALVFVSLWYNRFLGLYSPFFSFTSNIILVAAVHQGYQNFSRLLKLSKKSLAQRRI